MKKRIIYLMIFLLFIACYMPWNDFEFGDQIEFAVSEKLYESAGTWIRCDSVSNDSRCPKGMRCIVPGDADIHFTLNAGVLDTVLVLNTDSLRTRQILCPDDTYIFIELDSLRPYPTADEEMQQSDYRIYTSVDRYEALVRKPNIYLYPKEKKTISVELQFLQNGAVVKSIPPYPEKWQNITVTPQGCINSKYDYLFYEAGLSDQWQYAEGWVVKRQQLFVFFQLTMEKYGFEKNEIRDFVEFWIPRLKTSPYYAVYPQDKEMIDRQVMLSLSDNPDSILRLFFVLKPMNDFIDLPKPTIIPFERHGFTVTEWGVINE